MRSWLRSPLALLILAGLFLLALAAYHQRAQKVVLVTFEGPWAFAPDPNDANHVFAFAPKTKSHHDLVVESGLGPSQTRQAASLPRGFTNSYCRRRHAAAIPTSMPTSYRRKLMPRAFSMRSALPTATPSGCPNPKPTCQVPRNGAALVRRIPPPLQPKRTTWSRCHCATAWTRSADFVLPAGPTMIAPSILSRWKLPS